MKMLYCLVSENSSPVVNIPSESSLDGSRQAKENLFLLFVNLSKLRIRSYEGYGM